MSAKHDLRKIRSTIAGDFPFPQQENGRQRIGKTMEDCFSAVDGKFQTFFQFFFPATSEKYQKNPKRAVI